MNQTQIRYILAAGWGIYAGVGVGYWIARRTWKRIADEEIESVKEQYANRQEVMFNFQKIQSGGKIKGEDLKKLADRGVEIPKEYVELDYREKEAVERDEALARESMDISEDLKYRDLDTIDPEEVEPNVEFSSDDFPEQAPEDRKYAVSDPEDPSVPYVISVEEFMDDDPDYSKTTLMYYEGDDILTDEKDRVIRSIDRIIGDDAIAQFGQRSGDNNLVYVRNERMEADYEVCREERSYQEVVLNIKTPKIKRGMRFEEDSDE